MLIVPKDCLEKTGFNYDDLLAYTGVFGIHPRREFIDLAEKKLLKHEIKLIEHEDLLITITSPKIEWLVTRIFKASAEIYIDLFILKDTERANGLGFNRLMSQIEELRNSNFKTIGLYAHGNISLYPKWNGYIIWAKYGFTMHLEDEIALFDNQMREELIKTSRTVNDLVQTDEGTALWKHIGKSWNGIFYLKQGSESMRVLGNYKRRRKPASPGL